jgi:hypothetical protein
MISIKGSTTTLWLTCIFLCAGFLTETHGQVILQIPDADSLFAAGNYPEASAEYERLFYYAEDPDSKAKALLNKAECYKRMQLYNEAYQITGRINFESLNDSLITLIKFQSALSAYLSEDFNAASSEMMQMNFYVTDSSLTGSYQFLYVLILNEKKEWNKAEDKIETMINQSGVKNSLKDSLRTIVKELYDSTAYPKMKNTETAIRWATFLPGSGHIYAGYTGEGIMNLALQAASLGFIGYHIYISHFITAFTIGSGMFQHFYFGGINRVQFLVDKRNYRNTRNFNEPLKTVILSMQETLYQPK